ncbi:hypothetical protein DDB_G0293638 [Dictyostelium discoideum AX4]|uniref:Carbohydrate binding domain-containing protein n=1 Tax=Dictyostelium discoideum TaxID=44689 RepID=Q54BG1_DICDI|nr:hypothetical protein DDB_G0293638 [Dictyostelium discoideum AX4]EAL60631.1 hypothetical protein DDB_G0293638 [Dictyostelium discoideum AX4]|eukprot:XP_629068.1 hypothetical protein DDB_G0293638 [Dictyostelium discoideum AX4]
MRLVFGLIIIVFSIFLFKSCEANGPTPQRCKDALLTYFVNNQNNGIQISYVDPNGKIIYARGNSMTAPLFSNDLSNTDGYIALSSINEDCFAGKTQPFSDQRTVEGFYDSRSFRITRDGQVTINNEGKSRVFNITDCSTNVFNGYSDEGRLYAFHIASKKRYQAVASLCSIQTSPPTTTGNGNGNGGNIGDAIIESKINSKWVDSGINYMDISLKITNNGLNDIRKLSFSSDTPLRNLQSAWSIIANSLTEFSLPNDVVITPSSIYHFSLIVIGTINPNYNVISIN